jgi:nucleoside-diphosphate-sugar epimerase
MIHPLAEDLDHVLACTTGVWDDLRGSRLFITGGTGFFGTWLLETFAWANDALGLNAKATVLTRNPDRFLQKAPHLAASPHIDLLTGDVTTFDFPSGQFSHVIHAATESATRLNEEYPLRMIETIVGGTRRVLEFARMASVDKFLLVSSGAVYGRQPPDLQHVPEDHPGGPSLTDPSSAYGEGKRLAELLCAIFVQRYGVQTKVARCFAFVGPHLPLDAHFAIGNFIRDALRGGPIRVSGDGTPRRSYLYAADLAIWLWTILVRGGAGRSYNVGSMQDISIAETAQTVSRTFNPALPVHVAQTAPQHKLAERYVPDNRRAQTELGLGQTIPLPEAIQRTIRWHRQISGQQNRTVARVPHE